jgi:hypothetical protein
MPYDFFHPKAAEGPVALRSHYRHSEADDTNAVALCMAAVLCCFSSSRHSGQGFQNKSARRYAKKLGVADIVHNEITKEVGRIVRIVNINGLGYIVVKANKSSGKEIEPLWRPRELKELRDRARRYRTAIGNES